MEENNPFELKMRFSPVSKDKQGDCHDGTGYWFTFVKEQLLVEEQNGGTIDICTRPPAELGCKPVYQRFFGYYGSTPCYVTEIDRADGSMLNFSYYSLRSLFGRVDEEWFKLAGRAMQFLHHHREHKFCSRCGTEMEDRESELAMTCPSCDFTSFPRVSPAVIMAVTRGNEILLGRAPKYPDGMYSTLAGFVEAGETLEEAVKREVLEETSIRVNEVRYVTSQPWPFPHSIMLGFTAVYQGGEIKIDAEELEDARWFPVTGLPKLPSNITIARLLIDNFIAQWS